VADGLVGLAGTAGEVAQTLVGDRQVALEPGVGRIAGGKALADGQAVTEEPLGLRCLEVVLKAISSDR
jgi:hypothetical protein